MVELNQSLAQLKFIQKLKKKMSTLTIVILAAGNGTRMKSQLPKSSSAACRQTTVTTYLGSSRITTA